jgi:hypothetical protein
MRKMIAVALIALVLPMTAGAETGKYGSSGAGCDDIQKLTDQLRALIKQARRDGAADRRFLGDLRKLVRQYDNPWRYLLVDEDFRDGNYTENPAWVVDKGYFDVTWDGLESRVSLKRARRYQQQQQPRKPSPEELAAAILGQVFGRATGGGQQQATQAPDHDIPRYVAQRAKIHLDRRISNAFAISAVIAGRGNSGGIDLAVYQGKKKRRSGYRVSYVPGEGIALLRTSKRGNTIVERSQTPVNLSDGTEHTVVWTRHPSGEMALSIDGAQLFSIADRGYRDDFDGFAFVNRGGQYLLRHLTVFGVR